jgi:ribonuclease HII
MTVQMSDAMFSHDRDLARARGAGYVCGADEVGHGAWAGPLVVAAVRFDYDRLDADPGMLERLARLKESKDLKPHQRAALLPVIMEVAHMVAVVVVSAAQIDRDGARASNMRAFCGALRAVATAESVNLVDWHELPEAEAWGFEDSPQAVKGGDGKSAAIAAASIVAKETRDQLMRWLDAEYPGYGFAAHKGYGGGTGEHEAAIRKMGRLSPAHRLSVHPKVYAEVEKGRTARALS